MRALGGGPGALRGGVAPGGGVERGRPGPTAAACVASLLGAVTVLVPAAPPAAQDAGALGERESRAAPAPHEPHRTDLAAYLGWRVFQRHCASCHGADAEGSSFAPDLAPRIARMTRDRFVRVLESGYPGARPPDLGPWAAEPDVRRYADALWSYLEARARGTLPPGPVEPR